MISLSPDNARFAPLLRERDPCPIHEQIEILKRIEEVYALRRAGLYREPTSAIGRNLVTGKFSALEREERLHLQGLCAQCGKLPHDDGMRYCGSCREKKKAASRAWRERKRAALKESA